MSKALVRPRIIRMGK